MHRLKLLHQQFVLTFQSLRTVDEALAEEQEVLFAPLLHDPNIVRTQLEVVVAWEAFVARQQGSPILFELKYNFTQRAKLVTHFDNHLIKFALTLPDTLTVAILEHLELGKAAHDLADLLVEAGYGARLNVWVGPVREKPSASRQKRVFTLNSNGLLFRFDICTASIYIQQREAGRLLDQLAAHFFKPGQRANFER